MMIGSRKLCMRLWRIPTFEYLRIILAELHVLELEL